MLPKTCWAFAPGVVSKASVRVNKREKILQMRDIRYDPFKRYLKSKVRSGRKQYPLEQILI